ncbi:MAG: tRNA (guanosine(37)-N1)-methyltransferase TrmD [Bacteroidales bacterium]|jgi:tRNA (guanine37-N1)-methyltransferase|nr:tRNA (guanosine(37)-N1)-methyltransferase TrmD [Bacteroidales bacterium]
MRIDILTLFPEMFAGPFDHSIVKRAIENKLVEIHFHNIRDFSKSKHRHVDDYPFGGGSGMVMMLQPIADAIEKLRSERNYDEVIFLSPDGKLFDQPEANRLSLLNNIILLCGHYKGIDERIREHFISLEISIGNYVLSGGELAAAVVCDSIIRLIPGAMSDETSALSDSFQDHLLSAPVYTRPANYKGWKVPEILLSGHEAKIKQWRHEQALKRTQEHRPELLDRITEE